MFQFEGRRFQPPFFLNVHVYSCTLILNSVPYGWRGRYNEDTDLCLQALAGGWCTVLINVYGCRKKQTLKMAGGNTTTLYQGDGRLRMAKALEKAWPRTVVTRRRFGRPQHVIRKQWRQFDTPLRLKPGVSIDQFDRVDEFGAQIRLRRRPKNEYTDQTFKGVRSVLQLHGCSPKSKKNLGPFDGGAE